MQLQKTAGDLLTLMSEAVGSDDELDAAFGANKSTLDIRKFQFNLTGIGRSFIST